MGLIRVLGDGHSLVVVQDLIVLKSHHRKGIGSALLQLVLDTYKGCYQIQLLTEILQRHWHFTKLSVWFLFTNWVAQLLFCKAKKLP